jgi:hypothetical protein
MSFFSVRYQCADTKCNHTQIEFFRRSEVNTFGAAPPLMKCEKCKADAEKIFGKINWQFKEGNGVESDKPASYWNSAERNHQNDLKRKAKVQKEKDYYAPK